MHGVGDSWAVAEKNLHLSRTFLEHPTFLLDTQAIYKPTGSTSLGQIHCFSHCYLFYFSFVNQYKPTIFVNKISALWSVLSEC